MRGRSCRSAELDEPIGHEWASDPARVATVTLDIVDDLDEAAQIANTETSALAAGIVAEDADAVERFFSLLPRARPPSGTRARGSRTASS